MSSHDRLGRDYVVPTYPPANEAAWYHFLYGSVPGHQLDLIVRPELPHGALAPQHFSHLLEIIKYLEPRDGAPFAFAVANLSRDDTQHVPGHGGVALLFGLRVRGAIDHAGRPSPPFSHAIAAVDRELDAGVIEAAARSFYGRMLGDGERDSEGVAFYRDYVAAGARDSVTTAALVGLYTNLFDDLPHPKRSSFKQAWRAGDHAKPGRIVLVHPDSAPFSVIASSAARLASILFRSDVRWTSITTGREADNEGGLSIRMVPEREMRGRADGGDLVIRVEDLPANDDEVARKLFGATPVERHPRGVVGAEGFRELDFGGGAEEAAEERDGETLRKADGEAADVSPVEIVLPPGPVPDDEAPTHVMRKADPTASNDAAVEHSPAVPSRLGYISMVGAACVAALAVTFATRDAGAPLMAQSFFESLANDLTIGFGDLQAKAASGSTAKASHGAPAPGQVVPRNEPPKAGSAPSPRQAGDRELKTRKSTSLVPAAAESKESRREPIFYNDLSTSSSRSKGSRAP